MFGVVKNILNKIIVFYFFNANINVEQILYKMKWIHMLEINYIFNIIIILSKTFLQVFKTSNDFTFL